MTLMKSLAVVAALAVTSGAASAATCSVNKVTYTLTKGVPDNVTDAGCFTGNDKNNVFGTIFSVSRWTLGGATVGKGDGKGKATISLANQTRSLAGSVFENMMVALKQGNKYALFKLDTSEGLAGLWGTTGPGKGAVNDLSHASIWYAGSPVDVPAAVPLPAGGILLLSAMGGFALLRRRKKA
ncbi:VPLPA-CTERM sorting domain-containing protein [Pseudotabrizicola sediminis]|uniref:VPLPA-CTERM sorting domain-containing protein n=1 Tax=Pseudotabrizicola sediminis TaxID=2486418 RepID=A0ABY2KST3_9RHOB|nr:VPLPA-CTERM sorting domain-containing protein [Pseudotabrizicola sediminis]TGD45360.1 VPLPA-CTERM sorting domain-containing protein [Pseudotabrizicola sediminis]